tara:strand:+ start:65 stop:181 length:117 start_codon:yes stop_codon:yes gene_type:complete
MEVSDLRVHSPHLVVDLQIGIGIEIDLEIELEIVIRID